MEVGQQVRAFHPRRFGVINTGTVTKIGRKYIHIDFGSLLGGVCKVNPRDIVNIPYSFRKWCPVCGLDACTHNHTGRMDIYGRVWELRPEELCSVCGQPDNCGDCTHGRLSDAEVQQLQPEPDTDRMEDWVYEVKNGDTLLGYVEWLAHQNEAEEA